MQQVAPKFQPGDFLHHIAFYLPVPWSRNPIGPGTQFLATKFPCLIDSWGEGVEFICWVGVVVALLVLSLGAKSQEWKGRNHYEDAKATLKVWRYD